ncbi:MAG: ribonuclease D [Steroidobacteraceae bacterium]
MTAGEIPIDGPGELQRRVESWPADSPLALDTEFVRERTYFPRLCLVQAATAGDLALVDVLAIPDGGALTATLNDRKRTKLLHAARQDIEALLPLTGVPLGPVFDTQQAAALLGFSAQIGYADLVQKLLGVELKKGLARTDWARRPLSSEQLAYAADDVRYLPPLAEALAVRLAAAGRSGWLAEEAAALDDISLYRVEPAEAWRRLKGLDRMSAEALRVAGALAVWREQRAVDRDLPRGWVLPEAAIHELAQARPGTREQLSQLSSMPAATASRSGEAILAIISAALALADPVARANDDPGRPGPDELRQLKSLQERLQAIARELGIQPEVLATRRELAALVRGARALPLLTGWRRSVIGEPLLAAL